MNLVRRMRLVALVALVAIGLVATAAAPVGATSIYADDQGRFAIGVPDGWAMQSPDSDKVIALWTTDSGAAIFNIVYSAVPYGTSSIDFAKAQEIHSPDSAQHQGRAVQHWREQSVLE